MMKKWLSLVLCVALVLGLSTAAFAAEKTDLTREEIPLATTEADALAKLDVLQGTENGYELEKPVTRAEALTFALRVSGIAFPDIAYETPAFSDISGHWAADTIEKFHHAGLINGTTATTFEPERAVTGKEFVKILLTALGYSDITIENAYEKGVAAGLLENNFTKSVVYQNESLIRSDVVRLCFAAFTAKLPNDTMLYKDLLTKGVYQESDFDGTLWVTDTAANIEFADALNKQMPQDENYLFSPLSIKMALAMAANGATGETQSQILQACGIEDLDAFNASVQEMLATYSQTDLLKLTIANSLWLNESKTDQQFAGDYKNVITKFYQATVGTVTDSNAVATINDWASEKTNGKIPTIVSDHEFWAMLVNAIYFKGNWQNEFNEQATAKADFTGKDGVKTQLDFMNRTDWMNYASYNGVQIVELPYQNRQDHFSADGEYLNTQEYPDLDISMYILLAENGNVDAAAALQAANFNRTYVALSLPKFKVESDLNLNDMLKNLGVQKAFAEDAEFTTMFDKDTMFITDVLHKTYITVDEKGTEAAAVTAIGMAGTSLPPEPITFCADKPFTFVIQDNGTGEILFLGQYAYGK